jgi:hypothetical protein
MVSNAKLLCETEILTEVDTRTIKFGFISQVALLRQERVKICDDSEIEAEFGLRTRVLTKCL